MLIRTCVVTLFACWLLVTATAQETLDDIFTAFETHEHLYDPDLAARHEGVVADDWYKVDPNTLARKEAAEVVLLEALSALDQAELSADDQFNAEILASLLNERVALAPFYEERIPFVGDWGFQAIPTYSLATTRLKNQKDVDATLLRLGEIPAFLSANVDNMRRGMADGFTAHVDPLNTVIEQIEATVASSPEDSQLFAPFKSLPESLSDSEKQAAREDALERIEQALSAYGDVLQFLNTEYKPKARSRPGLGSLETGKDLYRALVATHTTRPDLTPEEVHELGLSEVARIRAEMDAILDEVEFEGSFSEFLTFLRTDEQFYADTPEQLMAEAARLAKDLDLEMPRYFKTLPRLPYGVVPVPTSIAPGYTTGRYITGDPEEGRAGEYWVNTFALDQRPLYELPALTAHEAVPGHHQQIAMAQEIRHAPEFRRQYFATAFVEGWGLYSETLASDMGLYDTPYERFGKLSYEMWRACRLVADTGLHWYDWDRDQAEACFLENSALAPLNIKTEVTRYIGMPGQALAYKVGELTLLRLREHAKQELGDDFDIREFHDVVLTEGAMPLGMLEHRVDEWINTLKAD